MAQNNENPDAPTLDAWRGLAEKELKGDPDALIRTTPEGIPVKPLYTAADLEDLEAVGTLPGLAPFVHGVLEGVGAMYGEIISVRQVQSRASGASHDAFLVEFPQGGA